MGLMGGSIVQKTTAGVHCADLNLQIKHIPYIIQYFYLHFSTKREKCKEPTSYYIWMKSMDIVSREHGVCNKIPPMRMWTT